MKTVTPGTATSPAGPPAIGAEVLAEAGIYDLPGYGGGDAPAPGLYIDPPEGNPHD